MSERGFAVVYMGVCGGFFFFFFFFFSKNGPSFSVEPLTLMANINTSGCCAYLQSMPFTLDRTTPTLFRHNVLYRIPATKAHGATPKPARRSLEAWITAGHALSLVHRHTLPLMYVDGISILLYKAHNIMRRCW